MSVLEEKKAQQSVFDDVVHGVSSHGSEQLRLLLHKDGDIFLGVIDEYVKRIEKGGVIIDAGCGTGTLLSALHPHVLNSNRVIGVDISSESIKVAKRKTPEVDFIVCDIDALPLRDGISDLVIIKNVLHHLPTLKPLENIIRLLNTNGFLLIDDKMSGNPIQGLLTWAYPLIPYNFKMHIRDYADHVDRYGHLPPITRHRPKTYVKFIMNHPDKLAIREIRYHGFFLVLGVLQYLFQFFPRASRIRMPFYTIYSLEKRKLLRWSAVSMTMVVERV